MDAYRGALAYYWDGLGLALKNCNVQTLRLGASSKPRELYHVVCE